MSPLAHLLTLSVAGRRPAGRRGALLSVGPLLLCLFAATGPWQAAAAARDAGQRSSEAAGEFQVTLLPKASITAPRVTLGAVATIRAPGPLKRLLEKIDLGRAPLPGRSRYITAGYIRMRMRAAGVDVRRGGVVGAAAVLVEGPGPQVPAAALRPSGHRNGSVAAASPRYGRRPPELAVGRGEELVVRASSGLVTVTAVARALEDAVVGDVIRVQVLGGKRLFVRVTGPHRAEVLSWQTDR